MAEDLIATLNTMMVEATQLRFAVDMPDSSADYKQITDTLLDVRRRLDRVDELLSKAIRFRAGMRRLYQLKKASSENAWDEEAVRNLRSAASRGDQYTSTKERYALANLEVLDLRTEEREAGTAADQGDEAVEVIRLMQRGLADIRHDLLVLIRAHQFETTLDR